MHFLLESLIIKINLKYILDITRLLGHLAALFYKHFKCMNIVFQVHRNCEVKNFADFSLNVVRFLKFLKFLNIYILNF